jgi:hypothetical protein
MHSLDQRELQQHVTVLGWLHVLSNAIFLVVGVFVFMLLTGIGAATGDPAGARVLGLVGTAVGLLLVALGVPGMLAGYGLITRRPWARLLAIVVGILGLINVPIGTAIGIYTLLVLTQPAAIEFFATGEPVGHGV